MPQKQLNFLLLFDSVLLTRHGSGTGTVLYRIFPRTNDPASQTTTFSSELTFPPPCSFSTSARFHCSALSVDRISVHPQQIDWMGICKDIFHFLAGRIPCIIRPDHYPMWLRQIIWLTTEALRARSGDLSSPSRAAGKGVRVLLVRTSRCYEYE